MMDIYDYFIYDRKQSDVNYAKEHPASDANLKGCMNAVDLDRIDYWTKYLADVMNVVGFTNTVTPVKPNGWNKTDFVYIEDLRQMAQNITTLKTSIHVDPDIDISIANTIDYMQLNKMEQILHDIKEQLDLLRKGYFYVSYIYTSTQQQLAC